MSNLLSLSVQLDHLNPEQRKALAAFISIPFFKDETVEPAVDAYGTPLPLPQTQDVKVPNENEQEAPAEVEKPKRSRAKKTTETTSEAFADKERTESEVDKYNATKDIEVEAEEVETVEYSTENPDQHETVTLDDLRALVTPAVLDNHRAALKAKIVELGGTKLADMPETNYGLLKHFLVNLK